MYDENRLREWRERKGMGDEDKALTKYYLQKETENEQKRMEEETKAQRSHEIEKMWRAMQVEDRDEKQRMIQQLMEAADIRGTRGKKKKKRGGKKKKK